MTAVLWGIRQCDTMRKAMRWLDARGVDWTFRDYRDPPVDDETLRRWAAAAGWERLLNRRGLTWRKLDADARADLDAEKALGLMREHPTLIKRPVLELDDGRVEIGFSPERYAALFHD